MVIMTAGPDREVTGPLTVVYETRPKVECWVEMTLCLTSVYHSLS